jgi:hypothetical protein
MTRIKVVILGLLTLVLMGSLVDEHHLPSTPPYATPSYGTPSYRPLYPLPTYSPYSVPSPTEIRLCPSWSPGLSNDC